MKCEVAILKNESAFEHELWLRACEENTSVNATVIDITKSDWLKEIQKKKYDLLLLKPPGRNSLFKQLYDERMYVLNEVVDTPIYPSMDHVFIYENKRLLRDWLTAYKIPHPKTEVFFRKNEVQKFAFEKSDKWVVAKTNIGASGNGVQILRSKEEIQNYIECAFSTGVKTKSGPKLFKGKLLLKLKKATKKGFLRNRMKEYKAAASEVQKGFVIFQDFIPHEYEWRCVVIGDSYFAHKKLVVGDKSSGTLKKGYDKVPIKLLNFIKETCDKTGINSAAIDVFEHNNSYLVNEIQCFFGQSDPYQMLVDGKPGRYRFIANEWRFEEGMFNTNECYDLRLEHALSLLK